MPGTRVCHISTAHSMPDVRIVSKQLITLVEAGYDVHLIAQAPQEMEFPGITLHRLPLRGHRHIYRQLTVPSAARAALRSRAALYHLHDPDLLPLGWFLKKQTGAAVVYDMHELSQGGTGVVQTAMSRLEKWARKWLDHVILAETSYEGLLKGIDQTVLPNYAIATDTGYRKPRSLSSPLRLLYTGTISRGRGLDVMLKALLQARQTGKNWHLDLYGIARLSKERSAAEGFIQQHRLAERVERKGWSSYLPSEDMTMALKHANVGLALLQSEANYRDSLPTKFYEYLQAGLPIVASDFPLWRDFIEGHRVGVVVDPSRADQVVEAVERLTGNQTLYSELSQRCYAIGRRYSWQAVAPKLLRAYERVLERTNEG